MGDSLLHFQTREFFGLVSRQDTYLVDEAREVVPRISRILVPGTGGLFVISVLKHPVGHGL